MEKTTEIEIESPFRSAEQRAAERERKRHAVLQAAVRMFNERGYHATSLDDVAASLGVTKAVIYHYLGNKDQVLFECLQLGLVQLQAAAVQARLRAGTGLDQLKAFLRRYAEITMADFGRCVTLTGDEVLTAEARRQFRALKAEIDQAMRGLIADGIADGSIRSADIRLTAFTLAGALNWPARWYNPEGPSRPAELASAMVEILCNGLEPRGSSARRSRRLKPLRQD